MTGKSSDERCGLLECLKFLAGFEADRVAGTDVNLCAGAGIAADAGFAGLHGEDAKAAKFDAVAAGECTLHGSEDCIHGSFGLVAWQPRPLHNALDEVLLDQAVTPFGEGGKSRSRPSPTSPMVGSAFVNVNVNR